jgi:hypothetical protein
MFPITTHYQIKKLPGESPHRYSHRQWFVSKQNPKTHTEFVQAIKWSIIDTSITYDKVSYNDEINDIIDRIKVSKFKPII